MSVAAIALGSNLGDREKNLREAIARIRALGSVRSVSSFHDTAPVGYAEQPRFLNAALLLETHMEPVELMRALLGIERALGRDRGVAARDAGGREIVKGPRMIDLDLLLYDSLVLQVAAGAEDPALMLPHPEMHRRRFVLAPLSEIAPDLIHPCTGQNIAQILAELLE